MYCGWVRIIGNHWRCVCEYACPDVVRRVLSRRYSPAHETVVLPLGERPIQPSRKSG
jgi:hypothetical protein